MPSAAHKQSTDSLSQSRMGVVWAYPCPRADPVSPISSSPQKCFMLQGVLHLKLSTCALCFPPAGAHRFLLRAATFSTGTLVVDRICTSLPPRDGMNPQGGKCVPDLVRLSLPLLWVPLRAQLCCSIDTDCQLQGEEE